MEEMARDLCSVFRHNVELRMRELGMNRRQLAEKLEVSPSYVSQVLTGHRNPGLDSLSEFAEALNIAPSALISEEIFAKAS